MGDNETQVVKSDGSIEPIDLEKVLRMVEAACEDVAGVSESSVDMQVSLLVIVSVICFVALFEKIETLLIAFIRFCLFVVSVLSLSSGITFS